MDSSVTDWISAVATAATFGVALVAAVVGFWQLRDARAVRRDQSRPYVTVDLGIRGSLILIEIRNIGTTPAWNVQIDVDPPFASSRPGRAESLANAPTFSEVTPMVAPGRTMQFFLDTSLGLFADDKLPRRYSLTTKYDDLPASTKRRRIVSYEDPPFILDINQYAQTLSPAKDVGNVAQELDEIKKLIRKWSNTGGKLVVSTHNQDRENMYERVAAAHQRFVYRVREKSFEEALKKLLKDLSPY
jgi:hypothetical protein